MLVSSLKVIGAIVGLGTLSLGIYKFMEEQRVGNRSAFLDLQLSIYRDSVELATTASISRNESEKANALQEFDDFKVSRLALIANGDVLDSANCLINAINGENTPNLKTHLYFFTIDLRLDLAESWDAKDWLPDDLNARSNYRQFKSDPDFNCYQFTEQLDD